MAATGSHSPLRNTQEQHLCCLLLSQHQAALSWSYTQFSCPCLLWVSPLLRPATHVHMLRECVAHKTRPVLICIHLKFSSATIDTSKHSNSIATIYIPVNLVHDLVHDLVHNLVHNLVHKSLQVIGTFAVGVVTTNSYKQLLQYDNSYSYSTTFLTTAATAMGANHQVAHKCLPRQTPSTAAWTTW